MASQIYGQSATQSYERHLELRLAQEHPDYYQGLNALLQDFADHLQQREELKGSRYRDIQTVLQRVADGYSLDQGISFNLPDSLAQLRARTGFDELAFLSSGATATRASWESSRILEFHAKLSVLAQSGSPLARKEIAALLAEHFDASDFRLLVIRKFIFRFLANDPGLLRYIYAGRPSPE